MCAFLRCLEIRREHGVCSDRPPDRPPLAVSIAGSFSLSSPVTMLPSCDRQKKIYYHFNVWPKKSKCCHKLTFFSASQLYELVKGNRQRVKQAQGITANFRPST
ncbi:unnamed protein product [Brassica oleracea]|uniref:(rape) hypothetical protein n=1 Tax=Brassica napus TaxID=3708 RepID=A0A816MGH9_BRANA|nr:unnamed protein product [Brassica napus]